MCSTQRTASIFPAHRSHGQSKLVPPKTWDDLFTAWSSITTSHGQPPVTPSYREARSQGVLIITQNLREAELVYLRTIVPSIDKPWRGSGGWGDYLTTVFIWRFRKDTEAARLG